MSSIITEYDDFKRGIADVVNKHIDSLPAIFIAEFLYKVMGDVNVLAQRQLKEAADKESEVIKDGEKANNTAHSINRNIE